METDSTPDPQTQPLVLDLHQDVAALTEQIIACESVSGNEQRLADAVEAALSALPGLELHRDGNTVVARTNVSATQRVVLAGHLDTVPLPTTEGSRGTVPPQWVKATPESNTARTPAIADDDVLFGRGATDMKGGVAVQLRLAAEVSDLLETGASLDRDVTWIFYDLEEIEASKSGLGRLLRNSPELVHADFAVLLEPTDGVVEGGCNGTCRVQVTIDGVASHSGRAWMGHNAIHATSKLLSALDQYQPRTITVEGLDYREGLNAVKIHGGIAGNVIPDACTVDINYRFAPDKTEQQAHEHVFDVLRGAGVAADRIAITDSSAGARPGLDHPAAQAFVEAVGGTPKPKYGWTDVARFSALNIPAVNFGPGDALLAHTDDEHVTAAALRACEAALRRWLIPAESHA